MGFYTNDKLFLHLHETNIFARTFQYLKQTSFFYRCIMYIAVQTNNIKIEKGVVDCKECIEVLRIKLEPSFFASVFLSYSIGFILGKLFFLSSILPKLTNKNL